MPISKALYEVYTAATAEAAAARFDAFDDDWGDRYTRIVVYT
jgi:transposase-like protein